MTNLSIGTIVLIPNTRWGSLKYEITGIDGNKYVLKSLKSGNTIKKHTWEINRVSAASITHGNNVGMCAEREAKA